MVQKIELSKNEHRLLLNAETWFDLHKDEFIKELKSLISIPSVSDGTHPEPGQPYGNEVRRIFDHVLGKAKEFGFLSHDLEGYAISIEYPQKPNTEKNNLDDIALVSHLDVVPAGNGWTYHPFDAYEREGYIVGRGSADNKGGALVDLFLLKFFHSIGVRFNHRLRVIYGGAEETTLSDLKYLVARYGAPYQALITDSPFPVNNAQKGHLDVDLVIPTGPVLRDFSAGSAYNSVPGIASLVFHGLPVKKLQAAISRLDKTLTNHIIIRDEPPVTATTQAHVYPHKSMDHSSVLIAEGETGHAAFPERSINAILLLSEVLSRTNLLSGQDSVVLKTLTAWLRTPYGDGTGIAYKDSESGRTTQNVGIIRPEDDNLIVHFDIRYAVTQSSKEILLQLSREAERIGGHLGKYTDSKPYYVAPDDPRVRALLGAYNAVMGSKAFPIAMGGGTHARVIPRALNFGPGFRHEFITTARRPIAKKPLFIDAGKGSSHGADEWVSIEDLKSAFLIYVIGLTRLDAKLGTKTTPREKP